mmetsp:Transcript_100140/g.287698  ORF Transcript_100140/g.287698 Transcript_100140/m.287698 type:complete len:247 (+) Transcript_100140:199-939(+)
MVGLQPLLGDFDAILHVQVPVPSESCSIRAVNDAGAFLRLRHQGDVKLRCAEEFRQQRSHARKHVHLQGLEFETELEQVVLLLAKALDLQARRLRAVQGAVHGNLRRLSVLAMAFQVVVRPHQRLAGVVRVESAEADLCAPLSGILPAVVRLQVYVDIPRRVVELHMEYLPLRVGLAAPVVCQVQRHLPKQELEAQPRRQIDTFHLGLVLQVAHQLVQLVGRYQTPLRCRRLGLSGAGVPQTPESR